MAAAFKDVNIRLRSASNTGARRLLTLRDDSWPDLMAADRWTAASDSAPGAVPIRASPGPTEAPQALASGGLTTGEGRPTDEHFSHTWLDRGGAEGDLMELNGWTSPQMLRRYGASARGTRARRSYDRIMDNTP